MITGFTRTAVMIFPEEEYCTDRGPQYRGHLEDSVKNIIDYLHKCNISVAFFATDDVAHNLRVSPDRWIITLNSGDMFFLKTNCTMMDMDFGDAEKYEDLYRSIATKHPVERGASIDRRFEVILKRDYAAKRDILRKYKLVVNFKHSKGGIKFSTKAGSNVMYLEVENISFMLSSYMSDTKMDNIALLGVANANMPVYEWVLEDV